jgi:LCP family protein required for cell wall assembly
LNAYENGPYQQKYRSKKTTGLKVVLVFLIVVLLGVGGFFLYVYQLSGKMEYNDVKPDAVQVINTDVENILLVGLDVREAGLDKGRNDLTMVLTIDWQSKKFKLASIMRDSYVTISGHGKNRINTAWYYGGPTLAINTVNKLFGLDMQKYIKVDFFGLARIIDALGGITVPEVTSGEAKEIRKYSYDDSDLKAGKNVKLTGAEAVAYGRVRHTDSDFQRTDRQREVFQLLLNKIFDMGKLELMGKIEGILPNLETNFTKDEIINKAGSVLAAGFDKKISQLRVPVKDAWENKELSSGASVLAIDIAKNKAALKEFIYD